MSSFEIIFPMNNEFSIDVTSPDFYNYDFGSHVLVPLQIAARNILTDNIKKISNVSQTNLIEELLKLDKTEYVARLTDETKEKLNSGEWSLGIRKETGETYAVIKDTVTGKNLSMVTLDKKVVDKIGELPELSAIQNQLADISKQIESLNRLVERVEQGQYNDRYAGFFSARQMVVEALASTNEELKKSLLTAAI